MLAFFRDFSGFLRPCEALSQVKKQQIKEKFRIQGPIKLYHNMACANFFLSRLIEAKSYFGKKVSSQKLEAWHQNLRPLVDFET